MWFLREKKAMAIYEIKNHKKAALIFGIVCICAMICTFIAQDSIQVNRKLVLITEQYNELEQ